MNNQLENNSSSDEWFFVFLPVLMKKGDIQSLPMLVSSAHQQPLQLLPVQEQEAPPIAPPMNNARRDGKPRKGHASSSQISYAKNIIHRLSMDENEVCRSMNITSIDEMTNAQANEFISENKDKKSDQLF